jgi:hypothetical protein
LNIEYVYCILLLLFHFLFIMKSACRDAAVWRNPFV